MADESQVIRGINWRETFGFINIFRAFRVAIHPSKLVLALAALLLLYVGGRFLDGVWPEKYKADPRELVPVRESVSNDFDEFMRMASAGRFRDMDDSPEIGRRGIFSLYFSYQIHQVDAVADGVISGNWLGGVSSTGAGFRSPGVIGSIINFFAVGPVRLITHHWLFFTLFAIWFLIIWAIFGGAIARIAAVHVARDEKISVPQALRFSTGKFLSFVSAPLIPLIIIAVVGLCVSLVSLLANVPGLAILVAIFFFLALAAGFIMTLVLIGTIGGFNLMYPTIAVEGSDSFDAISRAFSYVFARPWRLIFYTLLAVAYGAVTYLFVRVFIFLVLWLTHRFVDVGHFTNHENGGELWPMLWSEPASWMKLTYGIDFAALPWYHDWTAAILAFWVYLTIALVGAFAISFYFSANTIIYYLLRREVDATELDDVYLEQSEEDFAETAPPTPQATAAPAVVAEPAAEPAPPAPEAAPQPPLQPEMPEPPADEPNKENLPPP